MLYRVDSEQLEEDTTLEMAWYTLVSAGVISLLGEDDVQEIVREDGTLMAVMVFADEEAMVEWEGMIGEEEPEKDVCEMCGVPVTGEVNCDDCWEEVRRAAVGEDKT